MYSLLYIGYSADNRTKNSGYEHIVDFRCDEYITAYLDAANLPFGFIPVGKKGKRINLYFLEIISHMRASKYDLIHNFCCDNQLLFKYPINRKFGAIATTHLNYHNFSKKQIDVLKSYDKVIVLNSQEERILKEKGIYSVFIPHGFSKPYFVRNEALINKYKDYINICFSGICYRDIEMLMYFIELIKNNKNIILHILGQRNEIKKKLRKKNLHNVITYDFLSDDDYYTIISFCDYNFLPLTFATANNTLLEAEFLGIKSIIPNMEGINDYACKENNILYSNKDELQEIIIALEKQCQSEELMQYAQKFQWNVIYEQIKLIYDEIAGKYNGGH